MRKLKMSSNSSSSSNNLELGRGVNHMKWLTAY